MSTSTTHLLIFCISCSAETGIHTYRMLLSHAGTQHAGSCSSKENTTNTSGHPTKTSFFHVDSHKWFCYTPFLNGSMNLLLHTFS